MQFKLASGSLDNFLKATVINITIFHCNIAITDIFILYTLNITETRYERNPPKACQATGMFASKPLVSICKVRYVLLSCQINTYFAILWHS